jgi:hypothetical protein
MKLPVSFLSKVKKITSRGASAPRQLIQPSREWGMSLLVTVLVAVGLFTFAGFDFYDQMTNRAMPEVSKEHIPRYREQDAEFLIRYYEGRREAFESLRSDAPVVTTPVVEESSTVINEAQPEGLPGPVIAE